LLSIGINQRKEGSGTVNKQSRIKTLLSQKKGNVCNVKANTPQHYQSKNFAGITVNLNIEETQGLTTLLETVKDARKSSQQINTQELDSAHEVVLEKVTIKNNYKAKVYDLAIDNIHEYYANGLLVHNCRYVLLSRGFRWNV
jgi:intein/homing endonuclease